MTKFYDEVYQDTELQQKLIREVISFVLSRSSAFSNILEYSTDKKIVYKKYASLYFITIVDKCENELIVLEKIHLFVEILDRYFNNVCELDIIFNFDKTYFLLDEVFLNGEIQDVNKKNILEIINNADVLAQKQEEKVKQKVSFKKLFK